MTNYLKWFIEKSKGNKLIIFIILFFLAAISIGNFIEFIDSSKSNDIKYYTLIEINQTTASAGSRGYIGSRTDGYKFGMGQGFYVGEPGSVLEVQIYLLEGTFRNFSTDEIICYLRDSNGSILQNSSINGFYYYDRGWKSFRFNKNISRGFYIITFHLKNSSATGDHFYHIGINKADQSYTQGSSYHSRYASTERDFDNWATWHPRYGDLMFKVIIRIERTLSKLESQTLDSYEPFYTDSRPTINSNNPVTLESVSDGETSTETKSPPPHCAYIFFFEFAILGVLYGIFKLHERKSSQILTGIIYIIVVGIIINFWMFEMGIWSLIHPIIGLLIIYQALKSKKFIQR